MTLRAHIYIVNSSMYLTMASMTLLGACSHTPPVTKVAKPQETLTTLDSNKDGKPDHWKWFAPSNDQDKGSAPILLKEEIDLNFDGKVDIRKTYVNGALEKQSMDLDFDGNFDREETYENGKLKLVEISHSFSKKKDTWKFYEQGTLTRIEKDTNADGVADEWIYYADQQIQRIGKDYNYDGLIDSWAENVASEEKKPELQEKIK